MAKSFHNIIKEGTFEVLHQGNEVTLNLPEWLTEAANQLNNEDDLLIWAQDNEILHGLLHMALQQLIIALRAKARPQVKAYSSPDKITEKTEDGWIIDTVKCEVTKSIIADKNNAQIRIDDFVLKPVPAPGTVSNKKVSEAIEKERAKIHLAMEVAGIPKEQINMVIADIK